MFSLIKTSFFRSFFTSFLIGFIISFFVATFYGLYSYEIIPMSCTELGFNCTLLNETYANNRIFFKLNTIFSQINNYTFMDKTNTELVFLIPTVVTTMFITIVIIMFSCVTVDVTDRERRLIDSDSESEHSKEQSHSRSDSRSSMEEDWIDDPYKQTLISDYYRKPTVSPKE